MYCETFRLGSIAKAETAQQKAASPTKIDRQDRPTQLRKVFELLDNNFASLLKRILLAGDDVQIQLDLLLPW